MIIYCVINTRIDNHNNTVLNVIHLACLLYLSTFTFLIKMLLSISERHSDRLVLCLVIAFSVTTRQVNCFIKTVVFAID